MARTNQPTIRLPKISDGNGRRGISGYRGNVEVYEPAKEKARLAKLAEVAVDAPPTEVAPTKKSGK